MENKTNVLAMGRHGQEEQLLYSASMIPQRVDEQVEKLARLGKKVESVLTSAKSAERSAQQAVDCPKGLFQKRAALETIADAVEALGKANMNNAQGLEIVYSFTQSLAEINEGLFGLAAMGIAANNSVMQQLEAKLKGASSSELTGIAKNELKRTISILKNQSKVFEEQDKLRNVQKDMQTQLQRLSAENNQHAKQNAEQNARLAASEAKDAEHDRRLSMGEQHDAQQDELLAQHSQTDQEHAQLIADNMEQDARQDELISENMEQDARQDQQIAANMEQDARQDEQLAQHAEKDAEHDRLIAELQEENHALRKDLEMVRTLLEQKTEKQFSAVTLAVAIAALVTAGIQFFL